MLEVSRLTLGYRRHPICDDVSMGVGPGEIVALVAPNGAGKTTMLRAIGCQPSDVRMSGACVADGIGQQDDERLSTGGASCSSLTTGTSCSPG